MQADEVYGHWCILSEGTGVCYLFKVTVLFLRHDLLHGVAGPHPERAGLRARLQSHV